MKATYCFCKSLKMPTLIMTCTQLSEVLAKLMLYPKTSNQNGVTSVKVTKFILFSFIIACLWISCKTSTQYSRDHLVLKNNEQIVATGFQRLSSLPISLKDIARLRLQFIDENYGWLSGNGEVWHTNDSGRSWRVIFNTKKKNEFIDKLRPLDSEKGWLISGNRIYGTRDSGSSWQEIILPDLPHSALLNDIEFSSDKSHGWIVGESFEKLAPGDILPNRLLSSDGKLGAKPLIYFSKDGGQSWQKQIITVPDYGSIVKVVTSNAVNALAIATPDILFFNRYSWQAVNLDLKICDSTTSLMSLPYASLTDVFEPCSIYLTEPGLGWVTFTNGQIAESKDSGKTWCAISHTLSEWPQFRQPTYNQKVQFIDQHNGWWLIEDTLFFTKNAGRNWAIVSDSVKCYSIIDNSLIVIIQDSHLWMGSAKRI